MNKFILIIIPVVVIVVVGLVLSMFLFMHPSTSTSTFQSVQTTTQASNGQLSVKVISSGNYTGIMLGAPRGYDYIYFMLNITNLYGEFNVSPKVFYLSTNQGLIKALTLDQIYYSTPGLTNKYMGYATLTPDTFSVGGLLFQIPSGAQIKSLDIIKNQQVLISIPISSIPQISEISFMSTNVTYITANIGKYPNMINNTMGVIEVPISIKNTLSFCPINITSVTVEGANGYVSLNTKTLQPGQHINGTVFIYPPNVSKTLNIIVNINFVTPHSLQNEFKVKILSITNFSAVNILGWPQSIHKYAVTFNITWTGQKPITIFGSSILFVTNEGNVTPGYDNTYTVACIEPFIPTNLNSSVTLKPGITKTLTVDVLTNGSIEKMVYIMNEIKGSKIIGFVVNVENVTYNALSDIGVISYNSTYYPLMGNIGIPFTNPDQDLLVQNGEKVYLTTFQITNPFNSPAIIYNIKPILENQVFQGGRFVWIGTIANLTTNTTFPLVIKPESTYYISIYITLPNTTYSYSWMSLMVCFNDTVEMNSQSAPYHSAMSKMQFVGNPYLLLLQSKLFLIRDLW